MKSYIDIDLYSFIMQALTGLWIIMHVRKTTKYISDTF